MSNSKRSVTTLTVASAAVLVAACGGGSTVDDDVSDAGGAADFTNVTAGYVSAIDQIGLPVGLETGFFEDEGLDVELAQPFPTGVDAINALQAGEADFVQVGTPLIGAAQEGVDLVVLGNYTGSSTQRSIDETMAVVVPPGSDVDAADASTLEGRRVGVSVGSINHLYLLGLLAEAGVDSSSVDIVNTSPPDMAVALETDGLDAAVVWDPWPIVITDQVEGAEEATRGGGYIPFVGYILSTPEFVADNPEVVQDFLAARAAVDQWMRQNPQEAAEASTRWLPGIDLGVAEEAMQYNIEQLDPRFSVCNYLALDSISVQLAAQDVVEDGFDVDAYFDPGPILSVMDDRPELFDDLAEIPESAVIEAGYAYDRDTAEQDCP